jgi:hypothetical protein
MCERFWTLPAGAAWLGRRGLCRQDDLGPQVAVGADGFRFQRMVGGCRAGRSRATLKASWQGGCNNRSGTHALRHRIDVTGDAPTLSKSKPLRAERPSAGKLRIHAQKAFEKAFGIPETGCCRFASATIRRHQNKPHKRCCFRSQRTNRASAG